MKKKVSNKIRQRIDSDKSVEEMTNNDKSIEKEMGDGDKFVEEEMTNNDKFVKEEMANSDKFVEEEKPIKMKMSCQTKVKSSENLRTKWPTSLHKT